MNYRERRKEECQKLFEGFYPVISNRCRNPERVVKVYELARDGYFSHEIAEMLVQPRKQFKKFIVDIISRICIIFVHLV